MGFDVGEERNSVFNALHLVFIPGIAIMLTVLAFNLLGDGLRDALDPRQVNVHQIIESSPEQIHKITCQDLQLSAYEFN